MKALLSCLLFISSLSFLHAQESLGVFFLQEERAEPYGIKLDYANKDLSRNDLKEILSCKDTLEILNLRFKRFGELVNGRFYSSLTFSWEDIFPESMEAHFPALKQLYFDWGYLADWGNSGNSGLIFISRQINLEYLSLSGWHFGIKYGPYKDFIELKDFSLLSSLTQLKYLNLANTRFLPENIEQMHYTVFFNLEELDVSRSNIKGVHWDAIAPNLRILKLEDSDVNGTDINSIAKLLKLEKLDVSFTKVPGGNIKKLIQLPHLTELSLAGLDMNKADFSGLQSLTVLDLSRADFSIASFTTLQLLQNLKKLKLRDIKYGSKNYNISIAMIQELKDKLPNCEIEF